MPPSFKEEKLLWNRGIKFVAGADEVGCGPLAGPVLAAAVILPAGCKISGLDDSKKLNPKARERLYLQIKRKALAVAVARVSHKLIDKLNIFQANLLALQQAVEKLKVRPEHVLIDGERHLIALPMPRQGIRRGDARCASIAAASIIAKVERDRIMRQYHRKYPRYRFDQHKGYGTKLHRALLQKYGPCPIHRRSFSPLSANQDSA